jgi:sporulation protein YlmC with PRC-barrel domain
MDIPINAKVTCKDGPCGQVTHVILKPTTEKITHLVVSNEMFPETEFMISIQYVKKSSHDQIRLNCSIEEVMKMPIFDRAYFIPSMVGGFYGDPYMMWPYYVPEKTNIRLEKEHIPADEFVIRRGAVVESQDGHIGRVDEFLINPENDHITHLVLREGHLWGQKDVTIPVGQIDHYKDNIIYLKLTKHDIKSLPAIPIQRHPTQKK